MDNHNFFVSTDLSQYMGEWIAVSDEKVISHGKDFKEVFNKAKKADPKARPFVAKVPTEQTMIF